MISAGDLSALVGAAGGFVGLGAIALRPLVRIEQRLHVLEDGQADIKAEMQPNHGSSMRDAVNQTKAAVESLRERFEDHLSYHGKQ